MHKISFLVTLGLCLYATNAHSQEMYLSIDQLFDRAEIVNADLRAAQAKQSVARQNIEVAKSNRLPEINASLTLNYLGDGTILDRDFSNAMRDKLPHFGNSLGVELYQPIYTGGAITAGIDMAEQQYQISAVGTDMERANIRLQLALAFLNLCKMKNLEQVYMKNISTTEQLIQHMRARHDQGTVLKNDITRYELRLSSLNYDLTSIRNSISIFNRNLTSMLDWGESVKILPDTALLATQLPLTDETYWQEVAVNSNHELKSLDIQSNLAKSALKATRADKLPSIGLIAMDNIAGPVTFEIPAINKNYNYWLVGVNVKYRLSSLFKTNKAEKKAKLEIAQVAQQRLAYDDALQRRIHEAYVLYLQDQEMINTEKKNVEYATENYRIVDTRFRNDIALLTDMLDASTSLLDAETRLVNANINTLISYYKLRFISGTI